MDSKWIELGNKLNDIKAQKNNILSRVARNYNKSSLIYRFFDTYSFIELSSNLNDLITSYYPDSITEINGVKISSVFYNSGIFNYHNPYDGLDVPSRNNKPKSLSQDDHDFIETWIHKIKQLIFYLLTHFENDFSLNKVVLDRVKRDCKICLEKLKAIKLIEIKIN
jgi:hypothetical protein